MIRLRVAKLVSAALAAALVLGVSSLAFAGERRIATLAPKGSTWMKVLERGAQMINKATDGRVKIKYYPNGVQGDESVVVRKIRLGQLDGGAVTSVGLAMIEPSIRLLEMPMLFKSEKQMNCVTDYMWPYFQAKFAKKGWVLGEKGYVGPIHLMSQNKISSMSDLKSQKVWQWTDDRVVKELFTKMGVKGVPLSVPQVLASLTSGRINATYGSPLAAVALQWNTKIKYMTEMTMSYALGGTIMKKKVWDSASKSDQQEQIKIIKSQGAKLRSKVMSDNRSALKQMKRKGVTVVPTPPAMKAEFEKAAQQLWDDMAGKLYSKKELKVLLATRAKCSP